MIRSGNAVARTDHLLIYTVPVRNLRSLWRCGAPRNEDPIKYFFYFYTIPTFNTNNHLTMKVKLRSCNSFSDEELKHMLSIYQGSYKATWDDFLKKKSTID